MTLKQRILKSNFVISIAAWLLAQYIRFVYFTSKWDIQNHEVVTSLKGKSVIVAFWHGRIMMVPMITPKDMKLNALSSNHSDGVIIEKTIGNLGVGSIKGSTNKGGTEAIREIIKKLKNNECVAITPDGPRGPARKVNGNIVELAKKLDIPIIPVTFSTNRHKLANSWDSFMVAKPFGKGVFILGNPVNPQSNEELENIMNKLTEEADLVAKSL